MTLGQRIAEARRRAKLSQSALAKRLGSVTRNAVSLWESDKTKPSTAHLLKLPSILEADALWLLGEDTKVTFREVPLLSWVSAGRLAENEPVKQWQDVPHIEAGGLPEGEWIALRIEGTSMDKIAPDGAVIFVNRRERDLVNGRYYVIATGDGSTFKRYRRSPDRFEPFSSTEHETLFPQGQIRVVGRVRRVQVDF